MEPLGSAAAEAPTKFFGLLLGQFPGLDVPPQLLFRSADRVLVRSGGEAHQAAGLAFQLAFIPGQATDRAVEGVPQRCRKCRSSRDETVSTLVPFLSGDGVVVARGLENLELLTQCGWEQLDQHAALAG